MIALLLLAFTLSARPSPHAYDLEVTVCRPTVSSTLAQGRANFFVAYEFYVNADGAPVSIQPLREQSGVGSIIECISAWQLQGLREGSRSTVMLEWVHGTGWTRQSLSGEGYDFTLRLEKECTPEHKESTHR